MMRLAGLVLGLQLNLVSSVMTFSFLRYTESETNGCGGIGVSTADFASGLVLTSSLKDDCDGGDAETSVGISDGSDVDYYETFEWEDGEFEEPSLLRSNPTDPTSFASAEGSHVQFDNDPERVVEFDTSVEDIAFGADGVLVVLLDGDVKKAWAINPSNLNTAWKFDLSDFKTIKKLGYDTDRQRLYVGGSALETEHRMVARLDVTANGATMAWSTTLVTTDGTPWVLLRGEDEVLLISNEFYARLSTEDGTTLLFDKYDVSGEAKFGGGGEDGGGPTLVTYDAASDSIFSVTHDGTLYRHHPDDGTVLESTNFDAELAIYDTQTDRDDRTGTHATMGVYATAGGVINVVGVFSGDVDDEDNYFHAWHAVIETCVDSNHWYKANSPSKDCSWVAGFPESRCLVKGDGGVIAFEQCIDSCGSCGVACEDSAEWHKKYEPEKDCEWVKRAFNRCLAFGEDGSAGYTQCRRACQTCEC